MVEYNTERVEEAVAAFDKSDVDSFYAVVNAVLDAGVSEREIANASGCSRGTVTGWFRETDYFGELTRESAVRVLVALVGVQYTHPSTHVRSLTTTEQKDAFKTIATKIARDSYKRFGGGEHDSALIEERDAVISLAEELSTKDTITVRAIRKAVYSSLLDPLDGNVSNKLQNAYFDATEPKRVAQGKNQAREL